MTEQVRLVIWDLDDTFWKGTVTEGGIQEYVQAHHEIVIELARRGIMSSICSKNDGATILPILERKGILDYFIFPSISWDSNGTRLAQLVETAQLRAPTVMFIDDNPNNRAEAVAVVPGIQIEDETFISRMLADPRFTGKDDTEFTRLKQYRLLEQRKRDETRATGSNDDFLRSCDVRVYIEYDIEANLDRAIELINRTNQLNFTKRRLPEEPEAARRQLRDEMKPWDRSCGLVRVADKYGDYGFVGFFMTGMMRRVIEVGASNTHFEHLCFSCRTLGMLIEKWVYEYLGRPELKVVGDVLTDLYVPRNIDWVRHVPSLNDVMAKHPKIAPQIVLYGGCEANAIGIYLGAHTDKLDVYGNYVANGLFVSVNYAARLLDLCDRDGQTFVAEAQALGLPLHLEMGDIFANATHGALFVVNLAIDAQGSVRLRHKVHDWIFVLSPNGLRPDVLYRTPKAELAGLLDAAKSTFTAEQQDYILQLGDHLRKHYEEVDKPDDVELGEEMRAVIARVPTGSKLVIVADHDQARPSYALEQLISLPWVTKYKSLIANIASEFSHVGFASFSDVLNGPGDLAGGNHYNREVYLRLAQRIVEVANTIQPRSDSPVSKRRQMRLASAQQTQRRRESEAHDLVKAGYEYLMRRPPDLTAEQYYVNALADGRMSSADFLRAITRSSEFKDKWEISEANSNH